MTPEDTNSPAPDLRILDSKVENNEKTIDRLYGSVQAHLRIISIFNGVILAFLSFGIFGVWWQISENKLEISTQKLAIANRFDKQDQSFVQLGSELDTLRQSVRDFAGLGEENQQRILDTIASVTNRVEQAAAVTSDANKLLQDIKENTTRITTEIEQIKGN